MIVLKDSCFLKFLTVSRVLRSLVVPSLLVNRCVAVVSMFPLLQNAVSLVTRVLGLRVSWCNLLLMINRLVL